MAVKHVVVLNSTAVYWVPRAKPNVRKVLIESYCEYTGNARKVALCAVEIPHP